VFGTVIVYTLQGKECFLSDFFIFKEGFIMINDYEATKPITTDAYIPSVDVRESTVSTLNGLIAICKDGETGFKEAADNVKREDLKGLFVQLSAQRSNFITDLQSLVDSLGGDPADSGHISAALHRAWINVKGAFTGMDDAAALAECERGEDSAKTAYKDALQEDLPDFVRETVQNQHYSILAAHDRIKALRDEETTMKSSSARQS